MLHFPKGKWWNSTDLDMYIEIEPLPFEIYKVWGCPEKDPKGELHSPIRFTTASTAPSLLFLSLLYLYKCAAKRKAHAKRATRCAAEKTKSMR